MVKPSGQAQGGGLPDLPSLQPLPTTAERAAEVIRENIFEGRFAPGMALPEAAMSKALQVSRNTVREAFRTLVGENLLAYEVHKGVMVRALTVDDVLDIYRLRRMFELSVFDRSVESVENRQGMAIDNLENIVVAAELAAENRRWTDVGTANLRFHAEIVDAHHSARITEIFRHLMTELRLGFLAVADPASLHGPFLQRNREIHNYIVDGRLDEARRELASYLDDAEGRVISAVRDSGEYVGG